MKNRYDVIIIGSGIGGLVSGCYLAKEKLKVLIVEQHYQVGGYCSSFKRNGYLFDVGVHYLGGVKKGILATISDELDLRCSIKFNRFDPSDKIILPDITTYIRSDPQDTIREFKKSFPQEKKNIDSFFSFIVQDNFYNIYRKTVGISLSDLLSEFFKNDRLKSTFNVLLRNIGLCAQDASALAFIVFFREYILDPGYYPVGGMQSFSEALKDRFIKLGGEIIFKKRVEKILTNNNSVKGVLLDDNKIIKSDYIVSNADIFNTFNQFLDIKTKEKNVLKKLAVSPSAFIVYLGLRENPGIDKKNFCNTWPYFTNDLNKSPVLSKENIVSGDIFLTMISFPSKHDPKTYVSKKMTVGLFAIVNYENMNFWAGIRDNFAEKLITEAEKIIPDIKKYIEVKITATPFTCERYTSNHMGSAFGLASTTKQISSAILPQKSSVNGLFLAGHWTTVGSGQGGIPKVAFSGRKVSSLILKELGKESNFEKYYL